MNKLRMSVKESKKGNPVEAKDVDKENEIKEILKDHINFIESLEVIGRNILITLKRGIKKVNPDFRDELFQLARDGIIGGFRVVDDNQRRLINNWKASLGMRKLKI